MCFSLSPAASSAKKLCPDRTIPLELDSLPFQDVAAPQRRVTGVFDSSHHGQSRLLQRVRSFVGRILTIRGFCEPILFCRQYPLRHFISVDKGPWTTLPPPPPPFFLSVRMLLGLGEISSKVSVHWLSSLQTNLPASFTENFRLLQQTIQGDAIFISDGTSSRARWRALINSCTDFSFGTCMY